VLKRDLFSSFDMKLGCLSSERVRVQLNMSPRGSNAFIRGGWLVGIPITVNGLNA
jgi:hypothetical protein